LSAIAILAPVLTHAQNAPAFRPAGSNAPERPKLSAAAIFSAGIIKNQTIHVHFPDLATRSSSYDISALKMFTIEPPVNRRNWTAFQNPASRGSA
jgi:hypothetical protein